VSANAGATRSMGFVPASAPMSTREPQ
jgi:hypothetical protein